jgi:hypothetical protein
MTRQIISQEDKYTVIEDIPIRTEEEEKRFKQKVLQRLHKYFSNATK